MTDTLDAALLEQWIGREEVETDQLTTSLTDKFEATIGLPSTSRQEGEAAPRLIHFCLCQPVAPLHALGTDGHPGRGGFLPPVPLPRRMWAGSQIEFSGDLLVGDKVTRRSTVTDVVVKEGRSGPLCFVTVEHQISGSQGIVVRDQQTIVYRAANGGELPRTVEPAPSGHSQVVVQPTSTLLFRYSALTFNGHRIHYDKPYAIGTEGYPGLVVHGPLQATLLYHLAVQSRVGPAPDRFVFRSQSTLFDGVDFHLNAGLVTDGKLSLWSARPGGPIAMQAEASWL